VNPSLESFGLARLRDTLTTAAVAGLHRPTHLVSAVRQAVQQFAASAEQADDLTLLAVGRAGA